MSLPRIFRSPGHATWYESSFVAATHVVVPVEAVVTRKCDKGVDPPGYDAHDVHGEWCCGGSGTLEAVVYDPHGILGSQSRSGAEERAALAAKMAIPKDGGL